MQTESPVWLDSPPRKGDPQDLPLWYREFQDASWERFLELPLPRKTDETWRYADLKKSRFERLHAAEPVSETGSLLERAEKDRRNGCAAHFVFGNGELLDSGTENLPGNVVCLPFEEALKTQGDRLRSHFDVDAKRLGDEKFAALSGAATNYGVVLIVPNGAVIEGPVMVQHFVGGDTAPVFPRTLVIAEANSRVRIIETFESVEERVPGLVVGVADLEAIDGGKVEHVLVQNLNESSKQVHLATSKTGRDASVHSVILNLGGAWVRDESINRMVDTGADTRIYGVNLSDGIQEFDQRTLQIHEAQFTTSDLLIKNALYEQSRGIFGGLIQVLPGAHNTDSFQSCRSLLGSEEVEMNAMPGLEIDADQVRCSHGATSGRVSDDEIFYLRTRGIAREEAERIVSCGFLCEAFEKIGDPELAEWLTGLVEEKFDRI